MLNEQLSSSNFNHHATNNSITPTTSTSQLIKQTLSPLVHHRPIPPATSNSTSHSNSKSDALSPLKMKPNSISSSSFGSYHQISNAVSMYNNGGGGSSSSNGNNGSATIHSNGSKHNFSLSTSIENALPSQRTSSPSRSLSSNTNSNTNTNTLPSQHVGRYQFESNYSLKNAKSKNYTSPGNATFYNALNSISVSSTTSSSSPPSNAMAMAMINQTSTTGVTLSSSPSTNISNNTHIYGTLPKSSVVSAVASEFEQLIARNASGSNHSGITGGSGMSASNIVSNNHGNYNTLGSYRVQYSSTNPFLNHFGETSTSDDK